jgi:CRISPR/Cas system-associated protein Csx1
VIPEHVAHFSDVRGKRKTLVNPKIWHAITLRIKEVAMAQERLAVRKIKEVMRLKYEAKLSNRAIAARKTRLPRSLRSLAMTRKWFFNSLLVMSAYKIAKELPPSENP